jgi:ankyrin repeat protein
MNEFIELLIEKGASLDATNNCSNTPLQLASAGRSGSWHGHNVLLKTLLKHTNVKEDTMPSVDAAGNTPLHLAAKGHSKASSGYYVTNKKTSNVGEILDQSSHSELVRQAGIQNIAGKTPLMVLAERNDASEIFDRVLRLSTESKSAINMQDDEGNTALHLVYSKRNTGFLHRAAALLTAGASCKQNSMGKSPLHVSMHST